MKNVVLAISHPSKETVYGMVHETWRDLTDSNARIQRLGHLIFHHNEARSYLDALTRQVNLSKVLGPEAAADFATDYRQGRVALRVCKQIAGRWKAPKSRWLQTTGAALRGEAGLFEGLVDAAELDHGCLPSLALCALAHGGGRARLTAEQQKTVVNAFRGAPDMPLLTLIALDAAVQFDDDPIIGARVSALAAAMETDVVAYIIRGFDDDNVVPFVAGMQDHFLMWVLQGLATRVPNFAQEIGRMSGGVIAELRGHNRADEFIQEMILASKVIQS